MQLWNSPPGIQASGSDCAVRHPGLAGKRYSQARVPCATLRGACPCFLGAVLPPAPIADGCAGNQMQCNFFVLHTTKNQMEAFK
jgi:hypothetical protein